MLTPWKNSCDKARQCIKKQRPYFLDKGPYSQSFGFSSSHAWMWELDYKEGWVPKNWCFRNMVLEKTLESLLDCKEIKPVDPKGNQPWLFIGRTDAEAEAPILWAPDVKSLVIRRDLDAGKDWRQEEKGTTEDEMVGWHHWFNGHGFEQVLGDCEGQGSLACCNSWGRKVGHNLVTEHQQQYFTTKEVQKGTYVYGINKYYSLSRASQVALVVKNLPADALGIDVGSVSGLGRFPGEGHCNPLQYSCLKNSMDKGAWHVVVHGVAKTWKWLGNWTTATCLYYHLIQNIF